MELDDDELMRQISQGKSQAFKTLFDRHSSLVLGYLAKMCGGNMTLAEDLSQNTWLQIVRSSSNYRPDNKFKAWSLAIARNKAIDEFRKQKRSFAVDTLQDYVEDETDFVFDLELKEELHIAIQKLPEQQRLVIMTWLTEELSYAELATEFNTSISAIKSILFRAKANLREELQHVS